MRNTSVLLFFICLLTSCSGVKPLGHGAYLAKYDAEKRGALIYRDSDGKFHTISEVQPDVAISSILQLSSNIKDGEKFNAEQTLNITRTVAQLGERTEAVNILRDALHRLSEIRNNSGTIDKETKDIFDSILETVKQIILTDKAKAQVDFMNKLIEFQNSN